VSGRGNAGDLDHVEALVTANPGLPGVLLVWVYLGGKVGSAGASDSVITVSFKQLVKAMGIPKRLADLVKRGRIKKGLAKIRTRSTDQGYYPMGMRPMRQQQPVSVPGRPVQTQARAGRPVNRSNGRVGLAGLRETLEP